MRHAVSLLIVVGSVTGCTWVRLTAAGASVQTATADQVANCRQVGNVSATTRARVVVERNSAKVSQELIALARNEAAALGADTIVPGSPPEDGHQRFDAYNCGSP